MKKLFGLALMGVLISGSAYAQCCPGDCCPVPGGLKRSEIKTLENSAERNIQVFGIRFNDNTGKLVLMSEKKDASSVSQNENKKHPIVKTNFLKKT